MLESHEILEEQFESMDRTPSKLPRRTIVDSRDNVMFASKNGDRGYFERGYLGVALATSKSNLSQKLQNLKGPSATRVTVYFLDLYNKIY